MLVRPCAGQSGTWTVTGSFTTARYEHTATLLPNGNVLAARAESSLRHRFARSPDRNWSPELAEVRPWVKAPREDDFWFRAKTGLQLIALQQSSLNKK